MCPDISVAPDFEEDAKRLARYLDLDISLVKYFGLREKGLSRL